MNDHIDNASMNPAANPFANSSDQVTPSIAQDATTVAKADNLKPNGANMTPPQPNGEPAPRRKRGDDSDAAVATAVTPVQVEAGIPKALADLGPGFTQAHRDISKVLMGMKANATGAATTVSSNLTPTLLPELHVLLQP